MLMSQMIVKKLLTLMLSSLHSGVFQKHHDRLDQEKRNGH